jgi:hypothetical protein
MSWSQILPFLWPSMRCPILYTVHMYKRAATEKLKKKFNVSKWWHGIADLMGLDHRISNAFLELAPCAQYCTQRRNRTLGHTESAGRCEGSGAFQTFRNTRHWPHCAPWCSPTDTECRAGHSRFCSITALTERISCWSGRQGLREQSSRQLQTAVVLQGTAPIWYGVWNRQGSKGISLHVRVSFGDTKTKRARCLQIPAAVFIACRLWKQRRGDWPLLRLPKLACTNSMSK